MNPVERRLEILRLARPDGISNPDVEMWLTRAQRLEAWLLEAAGQANEPPQAVSDSQVPKTGQGRKPPGR